MDQGNFHIRIVLLVTLLLTHLSGFTQVNDQSLLDQFIDNNKANYQERVYVHIDRNYYLAGERIWFTIYCLDQDSFKPSQASSVAYIELLDLQSQTIRQEKIELKKGRGHGSFEIPLSCNSEEHVIRCYTAWQKNFGSRDFYHNNILIIHPSKPINQKGTNCSPGEIHMNFYPEGGHIIYGVPNQIVFTVTDSHNNPVECTGEIISDDSVVYAGLSTLIPGIGAFRLVVENGKRYHARCLVPGQTPIVIRLPEPKNDACALELISTGARKRQLIIRPDKTVIDRNQLLTALIWTPTGISVKENFRADSLINFNLREESVSAGVNYLTIFDEENRVLAERMFFVKSDNSITLKISALKDTYHSRDTIEFSLETLTSNGNSTPARLSVSASKSGSFLHGSHSNSFRYSMLFGNQIPQLYALSDGPIPDEVLDMYLIANSENRCTWLNKDPIQTEYLPEMEGLVVSGTILHNTTKQPISQQKIILSFIDPITDFYSTTSNNEGRFYFSLDHITDRKDMIIQPYDIDNGFLITLDDDFSKEPLPEIKYASLEMDDLPGFYEQLLLNQQLADAYSIKNSIYFNHEELEIPFYGYYDHQIVMEEFIKLPIMEEVFRELGKRVFLTRNENAYEVAILDMKTNRIIGDQPIFFLDGVPFFDSEKLLNLNPSEISSIRLKSERYFVNDISMDGIIDLRTIDGDGDHIEFPRSAIRQYFQGYPQEEYIFQPDTEDLQDSRVPNFQTTLFYDHDVTTSPGKNTRIRFIAPDSKGNYDIIIKALGENGSPGEKHLTFLVE